MRLISSAGETEKLAIHAVIRGWLLLHPGLYGTRRAVLGFRGVRPLHWDHENNRPERNGAGISCGLYDPEHIFGHVRHSVYRPDMDGEKREMLYSGWKKAVAQALAH